MLKYLPFPTAGVRSPEKAWFTYEHFDLQELERFDLLVKMKVRKPNTILAVENTAVRDYLAEQFEKSHALRTRTKAEKRAAQTKAQ